MPDNLSQVHILVKDSKQLVTTIIIDKALRKLTLEEVIDEFSVGRTVILLHPYYKMLAHGESIIRIDSRWEFFFCDESRKTSFDLLSQSRLLKNEADKLNQSKHPSALDKYLQAAEALLLNIPKFALYKVDFLLNWRVGIPIEDKQEAINHLAEIFLSCSVISTDDKMPLRALLLR